MISPRDIATLGIGGTVRQRSVLGLFLVDIPVAQNIREVLRLLSPISRAVSLFSKI